MSDESRIPLEVLFGPAERHQPRLTRDGSAVTFLSDEGGVRNLWVEPIDPGEPQQVTPRKVTPRKMTPRQVTPRQVTRCDQPILDYLLPYPAGPTSGRPVIYQIDNDGDECGRLYHADLDRAGTGEVFARPGVQAELLATSPLAPGRIVFRANDRDPQLHDLWEHDLASGRTRRLAENPGVVEWVVDGRLRPVGGVRVEPDGGTTIVAGSEVHAWREVARFDAVDTMASKVFAASADGDRIYLADGRGRNTAALTSVRVADAARTLLLGTEEHDVSSLVVEPGTGAPQWAVEEAERSRLHVLDEAVRVDLAHLCTVDDGDLVLHGRDAHDRRWLVSFVSDTRSPRFYLHDRDARRTRPLFTANPRLDCYALAPCVPVTVPARDGLSLAGYLTAPMRPAERHPLVLKVHGGPWDRDVWSLDPEAQWLASMGVSCLQVNFRGSTGYGKGFLAAGNGEWGRRMQFDLEDTAAHAVAVGWAVPHRVGIWGGSYGGYASLLAATQPDLFACAVSLMPPVDLVNLVRSVPPYWYPLLAALRRSIGDPDTQAEQLRRRSPLSVVDRIRVPVLVGYGANDPRVPGDDICALVGRLREHQVEHEVLRFDDEGHSLAGPANRLQLYRQIGRFLARHLLA